jgi:hypothetical protein
MFRQHCALQIRNDVTWRNEGVCRKYCTRSDIIFLRSIHLIEMILNGVNSTNMEQLPDEIWLLVFRYLHKIDLLYGFSSLNTRFQQIIEHYADEIDLSDISYKTFKLFFSYILPTYGHLIHSVILQGFQHLPQLFSSKHLRSIQQLQIKRKCFDDNPYEGASYALIKAIQLSKLTHLTLTGMRHLSWGRCNTIVPLPSIKSLTVHLAISSSFHCLLSAMINLEQLNLSVLELKDYLDSSVGVRQLLVPSSLRQLHIECGKFYNGIGYLHEFTTIEKFLSLFCRSRLQLLTLIVSKGDSKLANPVNLELLKDTYFPELESFHYSIRTAEGFTVEHSFGTSDAFLIHTIEPTVVSTFRDFTDNYVYYDQPSNLHELQSTTFLCPSSFTFQTFDCPLELTNLKMSEYDYPVRDEIVLRLIAVSPNLDCLEFKHEESRHIIDFLKQNNRQQLKRIKKFKCNCKVHDSFLMDLAQLLPNLQYLSLNDTKHYNNNHRNGKLELETAIDQARRFFTQLIHFNIASLFVSKCRKRRESKRLRKWFRKQSESDLFFTNYEYFGPNTYEVTLWL